MFPHRILIPLDGSDFSRQILSVVRKFLPPSDNLLILLRVADPPEGFVGHPARVAAPDSNVEMYESVQDLTEAMHPIFASQERDSTEAEMRRELQRDVHDLEYLGFSVEVYVRFGHAGEEIVEFVEKHAVDLVAMTTHSRRGINRLIFGSITDYVSKHVSTPLLIIHPDDEG
jgi:nucleotide-binding universal stress UspA family protein